jgi:hypothetical protein
MGFLEALVLSLQTLQPFVFDCLVSFSEKMSFLARPTGLG